MIEDGERSIALSPNVWFHSVCVGPVELSSNKGLPSLLKYVRLAREKVSTYVSDVTKSWYFTLHRYLTSVRSLSTRHEQYLLYSRYTYVDVLGCSKGSCL